MGPALQRGELRFLSGRETDTQSSHKTGKKIYHKPNDSVAALVNERTNLDEACSVFWVRVYKSRREREHMYCCGWGIGVSLYKIVVVLSYSAG